MIIVVKKRTNAKSGHTNVTDRQHVGAYKSTPLSVSNCERAARNRYNFEDRFVRTDFCGQLSYSSIYIYIYMCFRLQNDTRWLFGGPTGSSRRQCVYMLVTNNREMYTNEDCDLQLPSICEFQGGAYCQRISVV